MDSALKRLIGLGRILIAAASLLVGLVGLRLFWQARQPLADGFLSGSQLLLDTLDTTATALVVVDQALQTTSNTVGALEQATLGVAQTISDTRPSVASASTLVGRDLVSATLSVRATMASAATSARLIDDVMTALSQITLLNLSYAPPVLLSASLEGVAVSLDGLPPALALAAGDLQRAGDNLGRTSDGFVALAAEIARIKLTLVAAAGVVAEYQAEVARLREAVVVLRAQAPTVLTGLAVVATFVVYWLAVSQLREIAAGLRWLREG